MNKEQAKKIIKETFENKFDIARFSRFIVELLNLKSNSITDYSVAFNINQVPSTYKPFINSFEKITGYKSDKDTLDVLVIWLNKKTSIERARTLQRNFIAWYLRGGCDGEMKDAAIAAFVSPDEKDWRFSLIKMDYSLGEDKKGRVKISEEFTPAKRWSFLVGSNERSHTAQSQLIDILTKDDVNITLAQIEEAFNVEKVTKEFFNKYRELFFWTKETLDEIVAKDDKIKSDFKEKNINTIDFSKKLLGQIVFLYFLQKKGWFGVARDADWGTGPKNFLRELFEGKHGNYINFYNDILEPLFYEALRYDRSHDEDYYKLFDCKIPFLNGGLFDPIGDYSWVKTDINLPNELFSNKNETKEGDKGTGILDIFDRYNFTVKEDEPLEKEVAVDPEMLGKVFENLLEVKDRKSKGTYYTPREIVHYMCQQSLIDYLVTELEEKISKEDIEKFVKHGGQFGENNINLEEKLKDLPENIAKNAKSIDEDLEVIKVCDPAVGSGAFLVGMMSEIVKLRNVLSNYIKDSNGTTYSFKRDCIENSLYGVDIDPSAVEIAKLRLWLSLVVDEDDIKKIKPLPNLDYKIMQGDSLTEEFYGISLDIEKRKEQFQLELTSEADKLDLLIIDLYQKQQYFFNSVYTSDKQKRKQEIEESIIKIFQFELQRKEVFDPRLVKELEEKLLKTTSGNKQKNFFPWKLYFANVFRQKGGFDIVIANPPYIQLQKDNELSISLGKQGYKTYSKTGDIYCLFFEKGISILKEKGILVFISSNTWMRTEYGEKLRKFFLENVNPKLIINFNDLRIFGSATVETSIILIQKTLFSGKILAIDIKDNIHQFESLSNYIKNNAFFLNDFDKKSWTIINNNQRSLKSKIEKLGTNLKYWDVLINYGIKTGFNEAFFINTKLRNEFLKKDSRNSNIIRPLIRGRDIGKYSINYSDLWLINTHNGLKRFGINRINVIEDYPFIYEHLKKYSNQLKTRKDQGEHWTNLRDCAYINDFEKEKIVWLAITDKPKFALDTATFVSAPAYIMTGTYNKYLIAILNSKLCEWYLDKITSSTGQGTNQWSKVYVEQIPILKPDIELQKPLIKLVNKILDLTKDKNYPTDLKKQNLVTEYESEIDKLVYQLYELKSQEIDIIENFKN